MKMANPWAKDTIVAALNNYSTYTRDFNKPETDAMLMLANDIAASDGIALCEKSLVKMVLSSTYGKQEHVETDSVRTPTVCFTTGAAHNYVSRETVITPGLMADEKTEITRSVYCTYCSHVVAW